MIGRSGGHIAMLSDVPQAGIDKWLAAKPPNGSAVTRFAPNGGMHRAGSSNNPPADLDVASWASSSTRFVQDMMLAEKLLAVLDGRAFMEYYCRLCAPQLKGFCDLRSDVCEQVAAQQKGLNLTA